MSATTSVSVADQATWPYFERQKVYVESELTTFVSSLDHLKLRDRISYVLLSNGKRLRPVMVIAAAQSVGGRRKEVRNLALAFECLHSATLVHDDILDQDTYRREIPAVHEKWSVEDAILTGDALISLAIKLTADYGAEIIRITSDTGIALCEGTYIDLSPRMDNMSETEYLEKISKKSASLFQAATHCGGLAAGGTSREIECLKAFGNHFGLVYQLNDDLSDIALAGRGIPKDLRHSRINLPLIHMFEHSTFSEKERLVQDLEFLATKRNSPGTVTALDRIMRGLQEKGSLKYCQGLLSEYTEKAVSDLEPLRNTESKSSFIQLVRSIKSTDL